MHRLTRQADMPVQRLAQREGRQHGQRQQAGADDTGGECPATVRNASAACAEVWISVVPCACKVAAVVMTIDRAMMFEIAMPT
jgi:hypothetical protein